jgi:hypothetical protein
MEERSACLIIIVWDRSSCYSNNSVFAEDGDLTIQEPRWTVVTTTPSRNSRAWTAVNYALLGPLNFLRNLAQIRAQTRPFHGYHSLTGGAAPCPCAAHQRHFNLHFV